MPAEKRIWLVVNEASGSNDEEAHAELEQCCGSAGFVVERTIRFPDEPLPGPDALDDAGTALLAVFAGDGTVNSVIGALAGWGGAVLVLPGGTMNLLYHRLHGARGMDEVARIAAAGEAKRCRPPVIGCRQGTALADLLAGPGTSWYDVREALRSADVVAAADSAAHAMGETLAAPGIACRNPPLGRAEGYPLVMLTPAEDGIRISGFHAETPADYLKEGWALFRHRFREGPHDDLGLVEQITLASSEGEPFGILLDGERSEAAAEEVFRLVPCEVDLLATALDGR